MVVQSTNPFRDKPLSPSTVANYRTRLRKLWKCLPYFEDPEEREKAVKEIAKLENMLGMEKDADVAYRQPGRKREKALVTDELLKKANDELAARAPASIIVKDAEQRSETVVGSQTSLEEMEETKRQEKERKKALVEQLERENREQEELQRLAWEKEQQSTGQ